MPRRRREPPPSPSLSLPPDPPQQQQQQLLLQQHLSQQQQHIPQQQHHIQQQQQYYIPLIAPPPPPGPPLPAPPLLAQGPSPVLPVTAQSPEPLRLLSVLDSLKPLGFTSISDFLVRLFTSEDPAVRRRVSLFYTHGGIKSLLEIFMASKRARENGGDEIAVSWAGGVFKDEFDSGLVKGGVRSLFFKLFFPSIHSFIRAFLSIYLCALLACTACKRTIFSEKSCCLYRSMSTCAQTLPSPGGAPREKF